VGERREKKVKTKRKKRRRQKPVHARWCTVE